MPVLNRNQETAIEVALDLQVGQQLIALLNAAQGPTAPVVPPLVNHTQPTYIADTDYSETIDGVLVTYLTVAAVQIFWEVTLSLSAKHINALRDEGIIHQKKVWHNLTVRNSIW